MRKLNRTTPSAVARLAFFGAAMLLAGCARPVPPAPALPDTRQSGQFIAGTILAVRQTNTSAAAGLAGVLNALNQPAPAGAMAAAEIVIRNQDGNTVTLMQNPPGGFSVGDNVVILAGDPTRLAPRN